MRQPYDRSSKWLIDTHGDAILTLAGLGPISTFRAVASELVQPRQLPDGLLAFRKPGLEEEGLALVEIATYAKSDVPEQVFDDLLLTFAVRRVVPEVVVLVLAERGPLRVAGAWEGASPLQTATLGGRWRVVQLWNLPAGPLLDRDDPGLVPWCSWPIPANRRRKCCFAAAATSSPARRRSPNGATCSRSVRSWAACGMMTPNCCIACSRRRSA